MSKQFSSEQIDAILFRADLDYKKRAAVKPLLHGTVYEENLRKKLQALEAKYQITSHDRHMVEDLAFPSREA